jgi:hypothetical protein
MPLWGLSILPALTAAQGSAATLTVGPGKTYATVAAGIAAAQDGDTVAVDAGTYQNDYAEIGKAITLTAVGGMVDMRSSGNIPNRKAILITDADITIVGFHFSGAKVTDADGGNGAGIRYQKGNLKIEGCYFTDNQDGILGVGDGTGTVTVTKSEFFQNGAPTGPSAGLTHNLYLGGLANLTVEDSYFHGARVGHEFKSRAKQTIIRNSRFADGPTGNSSYSIDLPNGGDAMITGSQIEQGPMSQNPAMIAFGEEGNLHPGSKLTIENSLIANQLKSPSAFGVWNQTPMPVHIVGSKVFGLTLDSLFHGPANLNGVTYVTAEPEISTKHPWDESSGAK